MRQLGVFLLGLLLGVAGGAKAQGGAVDSVDVLHYDLHLDIGHAMTNRVSGSADVSARLLREVDSVSLELLGAVVDSVLVDGAVAGYGYDGRLLQVAVAAAAGDTLRLSVFYNTGQYVGASGWGGFYFDNNIYYNLGIALYNYPHNFGKTWFPCHDNFCDKATYHLDLTAPAGWKAIGSGMRDSVAYHSDGSSTWSWTLAQTVPTYLVGVAAAPFQLLERNYTGLYGTYPALLGFVQHDSARVAAAFGQMEPVIPMFERCFGPYRWERVGYVSTPKGSMEHASNIAFVSACMSMLEEACFSTMAHEFAHAWFGNLITCSESADMWINEGGASFCEEVAIQALHAGTADSLRYKEFADENLYRVLCRAHVDDAGFKPLYGQTPEYTYGTTVYRKGATVWHSLRGYLGDSLFYASMRTLFDRCAFGNLDSRQLRDSLSAISGVDLTDFFAAHVFRPGFYDYDVDSLRQVRGHTMVYLRQKTFGTDTLANGNRVWVTFFSPSRDTAMRLIAFDGERTTATFRLPFEPLFAVVDYGKALSKAAIGGELVLAERGVYELANANFKTNVRAVPGDTSGWLYVAHHWTLPDPSANPMFVRMADRYWTVQGALPSGLRLNGQFYYARSGENGSLDNDLFSSSASFDSVALLYRPDNRSEWRIASREHSGSSTQGYFVVQNLHEGQYTLAVVDSSRVAIGRPDAATGPSVRVCPNPLSRTATIITDREGEKLSLDIADMAGRTLRKGVRMRSGEPFKVNLQNGTYLFVVKRVATNETVSVRVVVKNF